MSRALEVVASKAVEVAKEVAIDVAKEGVEKVKSFVDSKRPIEKNIEQPKLKNSNDRLEKPRFFDSERPTNNRGIEQPKLRELSEEKRQSLKEQLGWTEKQLDKCTEFSNKIIYPTDRHDLEGKCSENGIPYKRKIVNLKGFLIEGVFPEMKSLFDHQLSEKNITASNPVQFRECNEALKEAITKDLKLSSKFTDEQYDDILCENTPEGYVWHHNEEYGKMQLVKVEDHDRTQGGAAHTGGKALWGGGY